MKCAGGGEYTIFGIILITMEQGRKMLCLCD